MLAAENSPKEVNYVRGPQLKEVDRNCNSPFGASGFCSRVPKHFSDRVFQSGCSDVVGVLTPRDSIFHSRCDMENLKRRVSKKLN